tara:strand:- start:1464 stop:2015 length:552 start_codon:yes stop_codon:yes gene_type:complete
MVKYVFTFFILFFFYEAKSADKDKIISNLQKINNLSFTFEQNTNSKKEQGKCIIHYPKKIFCNYDTRNNKVLVSNGKSLVIKTDIGSYYLYPLDSTPLNLILDKNFLLNQIKNSNEKIIDDKLVNFTLEKDELSIDIFFDRDSFNIIGWQILDIYQNISTTILSNIKTNQKINDGIFKLPKRD